jgi:hypothetical protein
MKLENTRSEVVISWFESVVTAINSVEQHIWALLVIFSGLAAYYIHLSEAGLSLISGGLAIFQKPNKN